MARQNSRRTRRVFGVGVLLDILLTGLALALVLYLASRLYEPPPIVAERVETRAAPVQSAPLDNAPVFGDVPLGDADAPVEFVQYAGFTCRFCGAFHNQVLPEIERRILETGEARLIVREIVENENDVLAAAVARCGGAEGYHRRLAVIHRDRRAWAEGDRQAVLRALEALGVDGGLTRGRVRDCLADEDLKSAIERASDQNRGRIDLRSVPSFTVNGDKFSGNMSLERASMLIDEENYSRGQ